jgi:hypothetical protein
MSAAHTAMKAARSFSLSLSLSRTLPAVALTSAYPRFETNGIYFLLLYAVYSHFSPSFLVAWQQRTTPNEPEIQFLCLRDKAEISFCSALCSGARKSGSEGNRRE